MARHHVDMLAMGVIFALLSPVPAFLLVACTFWLLHPYVDERPLLVAYGVLSWLAMMYGTFRLELRWWLRQRRLRAAGR
ncbi:MAG: hypothetical protein M3Z21_10720 [Pseudomonadota bacterium]|nr:hypothetical protein [Pseudomonadota bacterium]